MGDGESERLSLGYGFVEFDTRSQALEVLKTKQHSLLDGHSLSLAFSNANKPEKDGSILAVASSRKRKRKGRLTGKETKIIVRNLAFEATSKDIRELFSTFGQIKSVRVPRGPRNHRGFAFVDFLTHEEAVAAMKAVAHTHLYGRHLKLEWAEKDKDVDDIREETLRDVRSRTDVDDGPIRSTKRQKLIVVEGEEHRL